MEASRAILGELSLGAVLRQIAVSARELVGARYAALGVLGEPGEFIHVGMDDDVVRQIGAPPRGLGLLGLLVDDPRPLRLDRISEDPRRAGFPEHHPTMEPFLGVPVTVRDVVYGTLYLGGRLAGGAFTEEDETTIAALGATAGIAIENARLYEDSQRRQHWAEAAAAVSSALLDPADGTDPLGLIADTVLRLTHADVVSVVVPSTDPGMLRVQRSRGIGAERVEGTRYPASHSIAAMAIETGRGVRIASLEDENPRYSIHLRQVLDVGAVLGLPLHGSARSHGALVVARERGRPAFDLADLELSESFAAQAAIALELAQARADQQRLVVLQDRERIARDLHDHVIQRLFASGLTLEGMAGSLPPEAAARVVSVVDDLDVTIRQIRNLIFRLQPPAEGRALRSAVLTVVSETASVLGFEPEVGFEGPVDTVAGDGLVDDVVAVVREALSNVVRHARATRVVLHVGTTSGVLTVLVRDDGVGLGDVDRRSGLDNLAQRAAGYGGSCEVGAGPSGGTELRWSVPLP